MADVMQIEVKDQYLAGNELRLLVDTATFDWPAGSHMTRSLRAHGWLVLIDLSKDDPVGTGARVIGPLWSTDSPQSSLTFQVGVEFSKEDAAARKAKPPTTFDETGRLIRQMPQADNSIVVEERDYSQSPCNWKKIADGAPIGPSGKDRFEGVLRNRQARMYVQEEADGVVRSYDMYSGLPREDRWLTGVFTDLRARKDFHNVKFWLTDDAKYLVASPEDRHNDRGTMYTEFVNDDKKYAREEFGLIYERPKDKPSVFAKPGSNAGFLMNPPHGAISIDGDLVLLDIGESTLRLMSPDGKTKYQWTEHDQPRWRAEHSEYQADMDLGRIVFFDSLRDPGDNDYEAGHYTLLTWDFKQEKVRRYTLELARLFEMQKGTVWAKEAK
ncbi:MAG: hypothetical protein KF805_04000 [Phycisphaeraceae bacterium]|nr:hypothetical protein [Phycisphaeraceae bacterium]